MNQSEQTPVPPWVRGLVVWMDEAFPVPGTRLRIGLDSIVGLLVPGAGDAVTASSHVALLWSAFRARVPRVVIARMVFNVAIDAVLGAVPLAGDVFDAFFKANRRNLDLLDRHRGRGLLKATPGDYVVVFGAVAAVLALLLLPLLLFVLLARSLFG